jgi:DNA-binding XRE family transcriptional regulator
MILICYFHKRPSKKAGLTQLELADLAGVGKTTVLILKKEKQFG